MTADTLTTSPAEIAEAEGVTADACIKAAWGITELLGEALGHLEEFGRVFAKFADDDELGPVLRDAAGVSWAVEQFVAFQRGQLPPWNGDFSERLAPPPDGE